VAAAFPAKLKAQIQEEFGFETTVILRTAAELRAAAENNPFPADYSHVMFLDAEPNVTDAVKLDPPCTGKEAFSLRGKEIFLYLPDGAGRSKMAAYRYDKVLRTAVSMRNCSSCSPWSKLRSSALLFKQCLAVLLEVLFACAFHPVIALNTIREFLQVFLIPQDIFFRPHRNLPEEVNTQAIEPLLQHRPDAIDFLQIVALYFGCRLLFQFRNPAPALRKFRRGCLDLLLQIRNLRFELRQLSLQRDHFRPRRRCHR
jgi:hypothetical protein